MAVAAEIFAERWTPLILRQLFAGSHRFNDIRRCVPLISRSLLTQRLRELEDGGVVESRPLAGARGRQYRLTRAGEEFRALVDGLGTWGQRWAIGQFDPAHLDMGVLMWNIRRGVDRDRLPPGRSVVRFEFRGVATHCRAMRTWWLVLQRSDVDLCLKEPGFDVDLVVYAEASALARVWMGQTTFGQAVRAGGVRLEGQRALVQAFPGGLRLSHYADVPRPARAE